MRHFLPRKLMRGGSRGQSSIEYILVMTLGMFLSLKMANFFRGVFSEGMRGLQTNVQNEVATGQKF